MVAPALRVSDTYTEMQRPDSWHPNSRTALEKTAFRRKSSWQLSDRTSFAANLHNRLNNCSPPLFSPLFSTVFGYSRLFSVLLGCPRLSSAVLDCPLLFSVVLNCTRLFSAFLGFSRLSSAVIDCLQLFSVLSWPLKSELCSIFLFYFSCRFLDSVFALCRRRLTIKMNNSFWIKTMRQWTAHPGGRKCKCFQKDIAAIDEERYEGENKSIIK